MSGRQSTKETTPRAVDLPTLLNELWQVLGTHTNVRPRNSSAPLPDFLHQTTKTDCDSHPKSRSPSLTPLFGSLYPSAHVSHPRPFPHKATPPLENRIIMATKPTLLEPTLALEEEFDEDDESDIYEFEGEEGDSYQPEEDDEGEEGDEGNEADAKPGNMTALLLGKQNGVTDADEEDEEDVDDEYYEEDEEDEEGTAENPIDLSSVIVGSKRSAGELDADGDDEAGEETDAKKVKV
ncbi:hypothetical protein V8E55_000122 [Tylopilus felleus]